MTALQNLLKPQNRTCRADTNGYGNKYASLRLPAPPPVGGAGRDLSWHARRPLIHELRGQRHRAWKPDLRIKTGLQAAIGCALAHHPENRNLPYPSLHTSPATQYTNPERCAKAHPMAYHHVMRASSGFPHSPQVDQALAPYPNEEITGFLPLLGL